MRIAASRTVHREIGMRKRHGSWGLKRPKPSRTLREWTFDIRGVVFLAEAFSCSYAHNSSCVLSGEAARTFTANVRRLQGRMPYPVR